MSEKSQQEILRDMVAELLDLDGGLTRWEADFVESVDHWNGDFTPAQATIIRKIWDERIG